MVAQANKTGTSKNTTNEKEKIMTVTHKLCSIEFTYKYLYRTVVAVPVYLLLLLLIMTMMVTMMMHQTSIN